MTEDAPSPEEFARRVFAAQPFTRFLGAELVSASPGAAEIRIANRPDLRQQHGFVHGGVLSYLADNALTFAGGLALGGDALTAEFKVNYVRPATGPTVTARAEAVATTRRQAVCRCEVWSVEEDGKQNLVAVAQGTIVSAHTPDASPSA
ncbi:MULTISPECIES: PaaI family thioesterase [unclassified Streptomyces]|uniref:Medium/long-chain acyl-CoA thioesterase YigI n=1 Tax=Streptomyces evansiae TaxID=3075535 RepID=A0ABU2RA47_9ACTN|nr:MULTISPECIES: PaaI family thioesterase [unclassified Streptomyces]ASY34092.1 thioesterase [Streptomyces sp. CLI2509]EGJ76360.1 putative thioesterase [Streptomyces sp. Tu6071]MDT0413178.1 PaaI family thioesterase [Streptomyces sp. DSM 41979]MDT0421916.1 PaaI family thioesterase [Streptomyces sp. DSM 41859]MYQ58893.1 hotdog fold thioesterase [Streptomyces sp. SID4926]